MAKIKYTLLYLPLFEQDLSESALYISEVLKNNDAAQTLVDDVEKAILTRLKNPLAFEPFCSIVPRKDTYYRIYVGNYTVFYVVIGDIMEVRRLIYSRRDMDVQIV